MIFEYEKPAVEIISFVALEALATDDLYSRFLIFKNHISYLL